MLEVTPNGIEDFGFGTIGFIQTLHLIRLLLPTAKDQFMRFWMLLAE
jgi:hypothetical protein